MSVMRSITIQGVNLKDRPHNFYELNGPLQTWNAILARSQFVNDVTRSPLYTLRYPRVATPLRAEELLRKLNVDWDHYTIQVLGMYWYWFGDFKVAIYDPLIKILAIHKDINAIFTRARIGRIF